MKDKEFCDLLLPTVLPTCGNLNVVCPSPNYTAKSVNTTCGTACNLTSCCTRMLAGLCAFVGGGETEERAGGGGCCTRVMAGLNGWSGVGWELRREREGVQKQSTQCISLSPTAKSETHTPVGTLSKRLKLLLCYYGAGPSQLHGHRLKVRLDVAAPPPPPRPLPHPPEGKKYYFEL